ncbi:MAG: HTTM domain-containing protein [Anaerolineae bacterium]
MRLFRDISRKLFDPIDILPLVFFRVMFGAIMIWEVWRYFHYDRVFRYFMDPVFYFTYHGFHWVHPLPGDGMIWLFYALAVLAFMIMIGLFYRVVTVIFWLCFTYIFLLDQTQYLNHFYLISLISFLMIFVPAHRKWSVDALLRPVLHAETAPLWSLWLLRGQMTVVYVYGAIAKINPDWLRGEPMRDWLSDRTWFPLIGQWFTQDWMVYSFSYGGLLFDLLVVPLLLWHRTRWWALGGSALFHMTNDRLFNIGIFPHFAMVMTLLFLPPHWFRFWQRNAPEAIKPVQTLTPQRWAIVGAVGVYFAVQMLLPLRHFLYDGYVSWTEEGHNLAWHMKLRSKGGDVAFYASDPQQGTIQYIPISAYLNNRQISKMEGDPPMLLRFAHFLAQQDQYANHQILVWSMMTLNSRAPQLLIDPTVDLASQADDLWADDWVLPLMQPPAPQGAVPSLLISRRIDGALIFINMTEAPFPLMGLRLSLDDTVLYGADFGLRELAPNSCVIAYESDTDTRQLVPACNADAYYVAVPDALAVWDTTAQITVNTADRYTINCTQPWCIVTYE